MNLTGSSDFDTFTHRCKMEFNIQGVPRNAIHYFSATCGCKKTDFKLYFKGAERSTRHREDIPKILCLRSETEVVVANINRTTRLFFTWFENQKAHHVILLLTRY